MHALQSEIFPAAHDELSRPNSPRLESSASVAAHAVALADAHREGQAPEWIELLPAGRFEGRDGRGPFILDDPAEVIRNTQALGMAAGLPVDYDHATDLAAPQGAPAPAAGWIKELQARDGGKIFARVEWTERGARALVSREYRYISPVFEYDPKSGRVTRILRAALTNNPNLVIKALSHVEHAMASSAQAGKSKLDGLAEQIRATAEEIGLSPDALLAALARKLGPGPEGEDENGSGEEAEGVEASSEYSEPYIEESEAEMARRHQEELARCSSDEERAEAARRHRREREQSAGRTAALAVAKHPMVVAMQRRLSQLEADRAREQAEAAVAEAMRARRLIPAQREWAVNYALSDAEGFAQFVASQPRYLGENRASSLAGAPSGAEPALMASELRVCSQLGIKPEDFIAARQARLGAAALQTR